MNGTNKNMQIKKIVLLIKYVSITAYFFYKSIGLALLLYISITVSWLYFEFAAIYFFNKSVS